MKLAFGQNCSCGAPIVARSMWPETVVSHARPTRGLVIEETCSSGHVANFTAERITMTELADFPVASNQESKP